MHRIFPFKFPFLSLLERDEARIHAQGLAIQMPFLKLQKSNNTVDGSEIRLTT